MQPTILTHPYIHHTIIQNHQNKKKLSNILYGLVVTTTGGKGFFSYKQSFEENCEINYLIEDVFRKKKVKFSVNS